MKRRDFAKSLAALGLAPALPAVSVAAPAAAGYTPYMYGLGAHLARSSGQCSPALLAQKLRIAPEAASAMQAQLVRSGIITVPNAAGVAAAAQPYMRSVPAVGSSVSGMGKTVKRVTRDWINDTADDTDQDDQTPEV